MKYPNVIFYRYDKYSHIDSFFEEQSEKMKFSINITSDHAFLNNLYDPNFQVLVTFGDTAEEYYQNIYNTISDRFAQRWIHLSKIENIDSFNYSVNNCYIHSIVKNKTENRPIFSIFTTCYNSYEKILRALDSIQKQTLKDWEWVIIDDSPDDAHFAYLRENMKVDKRIRLYKRSENSGNIGNVKNEAIMLCRGLYVLEMDHDDEILPDVLADATRAFTEDPEVGFVYMDFINIYEDGSNFAYEREFSNPYLSKGYGGYYFQKYKGRWVYVFSTANINNVTMCSLTCLPNHPRIWRKETLMKMGNYSEYLPICDDLEILLKTAIQTKIAKVQKFGYIQYMNNNNNNFSLIRNSEINRLGPKYIIPHFFELYNANEKMKELDAFEDLKYTTIYEKMWKREPSYVHKYCNKILQYEYKKQYCILGFGAFNKYIQEIRELYKDPKNDFIVFENNSPMEDMCSNLDIHQFDRMKCFSLYDASYQEFIKYFHMVYRSCDEYEIMSL